MKKITLFVCILSLSLCVSAQVTVAVSPSVELTAILARTAGYQEYCMDDGGQYTKDTEQWFGTYRAHPSVLYFNRLRRQFGVAYDAVMNLAVNISVDAEGVRWMDTDLQSMDRRWSKVDKDTLLMRLNDFCRDTRFHAFFTAHYPFYDRAVEAYKTNVMGLLRQEWYPAFYGTAPEETFRVIIGCTNGGGNYGANRACRGRAKELFAIVGYVENPAAPTPYADGAAYAATLIHEFNHSFVNPLLAKGDHWDQLKESADYLYRCSSLAMQRQAYGNEQTVINESVVRAAVICYMMDNGCKREDVQHELYNQVARDFKWMPELVTALRRYARERRKYPTLESYYPEIAKVLAKYADRERKRIEGCL